MFSLLSWLEYFDLLIVIVSDSFTHFPIHVSNYYAPCTHESQALFWAQGIEL